MNLLYEVVFLYYIENVNLEAIAVYPHLYQTVR